MEMLMTMGSQLVCTSRWSIYTARHVPDTRRMDSQKLGTMLCVCHALRNRRRSVGVYAQMAKSTSCQSLERRLNSS